MSHLRVIHFDAAGDEFPTEPLSTAVLPSYVLSATSQIRSRAATHLGKAGVRRRWDTAILLLRRELMKAAPRFFGVAIVSCPARVRRIRLATGPVTLTADNAYCAAFVALGAGNKLVAGQLDARSFRALMGEVSRRVRVIMMTRALTRTAANS